ncbi:MAG: Gfo/Idh/MocA family oxidoreductase [Phycisphaerales bacterium]|nr:Gfo/Idh/MocA family oxidoreductase [Phycisphaerales bacterium]
MANRTIKIATIGGGMFGRDVVLRSLADFERCGIIPYLGTAGLDHHARELAGVDYKLVAIGVRHEKTGRALVEDYRKWCPSGTPKAYWGETPWIDILEKEKPDVLFVATPDSLHTPPVVAALDRGVHVVVEKPLALFLDEARTIVRKADKGGLIVGTDMHKRYDAFLRSALVDVVPQIGDLLYARAVLEEPLEVSTKIFKWAATSNPFSYVGVHWTDLLGYYLNIKPVSLHAVGQKKLLVNWRDERNPNGINTFDSLQVNIQYDNGMNITYVNAWVNPDDFEGNVNQEMEVVGSLGRVFVDQQDRGLRCCITGQGTRTKNPHFQAEVPRAAASKDDTACIGYCRDALTAGLEAASRVILGLADRQGLKGTYPDADSSVPLVAIVEAAERVAKANLAYLNAGKGAPVTARFDKEFNVEIIDPAAG